MLFMPDVIDIIHRITYESNTDVIESLNKAFGNQFKLLKDLQAEEAKLNQLISATAKEDVAQQTALNTALTKTKAQIDGITISLGREFAANEKLQKSVANTTKGYNNLGFAFSQVLREAPAFAFSAQTGLLAISNNIPIFLDQLKQAKAAGTSTAGIFRALGQSLFSFTGLMTIAISVLTIFGAKIFSAGKAADQAKTAQDEYTEAIEKTDQAATSAAFKEIARVKVLALAAQNATFSTEQRTNAILELQRLYPAYLGNVSEEAFLNGQAAKEINEVTKALIAKALAQAAEDKFAATAKRVYDLTLQQREALDEVNKAQQRINDFRQRFGDERTFADIEGGTDPLSDLDRNLLRAQQAYSDVTKEIQAAKAAQLGFLADAQKFAAEAGDLFVKAPAQSKSVVRRVKEDAVEADKPLKQVIFDIEEIVRLLQSLDDNVLKLPFGTIAEDPLNPFGTNPDDSARKEAIDKQIGYYQDAANAIISTFQLINDAKIQALDFELQVTQSRIIAATELAKRGNTEVLENELNNLNRLEQEREKAANKQLILNSLLAASSSALSLAQSIQAITASAALPPPANLVAIAATVAALASGVAFATNVVTAARGFKDGVIGLDGAGTATSDSIHARLSKGESVITAEKTQRYRPVLEAIHAGTFERSFPVYNTNNSIEIKSVVKELKQVKEAIGNLAFNAENRLDANGLTQSITTTLTRNQNRWKRG